jgi:hypothetical protein
MRKIQKGSGDFLNELHRGKPRGIDQMFLSILSQQAAGN